MIQVQGLLVDNESRCVHYHGEKDIISLQCYECKKYYACYQCHNAIETHLFSPYPLTLAGGSTDFMWGLYEDNNISRISKTNSLPLLQISI